MPPVAARVVPAYGAEASPEGREVVVTVSGGAAIVTLKPCVVVPFRLSVTVRLKAKVPAVVGVPLTVPVAPPVNVNPGAGVAGPLRV